MPTIAPESRLYVVVGIVQNACGKYLLQQRQPGKPCAGQWEFPGGKLEIEETPEQALARELKEELGITVLSTYQLTQVVHDYEHARVWLDVYSVTKYSGQPTALENQAFEWLQPSQILEKNILPPVIPILQALVSA